MSLIGMLHISRCTYLSTFRKDFHTSSITYLHQYWREKKGWVQNPNSYGPLTNLPDYSFKDNRPTPYGSNQMKRIKKQQEFAKRVIKLIGEVDYAVENHAKLVKEEEDRKQSILNKKLKAKGQRLLTDN